MMGRKDLSLLGYLVHGVVMILFLVQNDFNCLMMHVRDYDKY